MKIRSHEIVHDGPRAQIAANVLLGGDWGLGDLGLGPQITAKVLPAGDWGPGDIGPGGPNRQLGPRSLGPQLPRTILDQPIDCLSGYMTRVRNSDSKTHVKK